MSASNRTNIPNSLNEHWMPFTDNKTFKKNPRLITDAKGVYLTNHQGKKMIDASFWIILQSSWSWEKRNY